MLTPFERLCRLEETGLSFHLQFILEKYKQWFESDVEDHQLPRLNSIKSQLTHWRSIEALHGAGAAINLNHPIVRSMFSENAFLREKYSDELANSERYHQLVELDGNCRRQTLEVAEIAAA